MEPYARREPYPSQGAARPRDSNGNNYHYRNYCTVRSAFNETYEKLYSLHSQAVRGRPVTASDLSGAMEAAGRILACPVCYQIIDRLDTTVYVSGCAHVVHKEGCWTEGAACPACPHVAAPPR